MEIEQKGRVEKIKTRVGKARNEYGLTYVEKENDKEILEHFMDLDKLDELGFDLA